MMGDKIRMQWEVSKEQEENFKREIPEIVDGIDVEDLFNLIRGAEYRRGKEDAQSGSDKDWDVRGLIHNLNWSKILHSAIESRKTSWKEDPVYEWRNASDEICMAFFREMEDQGILKSFQNLLKEDFDNIKERRARLIVKEKK